MKSLNVGMWVMIMFQYVSRGAISIVGDASMSCATVDFHPEGQEPSYFKTDLGRVSFTSDC